MAAPLGFPRFKMEETRFPTVQSSPPTSWIFGFGAGPVRELSPVEIEEYRKRGNKARKKAVLLGLASVLAGTGVFVWIAVAAGGSRWAWVALVANLALFLWLLSTVGQTETHGLLCRRIARLGRLQRFERAEPPPGMREAFAQRESGEESEPYWESEERFEERLTKLIGRTAAWIEVLPEDDVLVAVEGNPVGAAVNLPRVTIAGPGPS